MRAVIVDAGPLIAMIDREDPDHGPTLAALKSVKGSLHTVWPALVEACQMLGRSSGEGVFILLDMVERGALRIAPLDASDVARIKQILAKFADQRLDLADAAVYRAAERDQVAALVTLDRRDFGMLQRAFKARFDIVVPTGS